MIYINKVFLEKDIWVRNVAYGLDFIIAFNIFIKFFYNWSQRLFLV